MEFVNQAVSMTTEDGIGGVITLGHAYEQLRHVLPTDDLSRSTTIKSHLGYVDMVDYNSISEFQQQQQ